MSIRYAKKRDLSEKAIFDALVGAGCDVERGTDCDLYVLPPDRRLMFDETTKQFVRIKPYAFLVECKTKGNNLKRRQPIQKRLQTIFGSQYVVASTPEEALRGCGIGSDPLFGVGAI